MSCGLIFMDGRVENAVWVMAGGVPSGRDAFHWKNLEPGFDSKNEILLANLHVGKYGLRKGMICR